MRKLASFFFGFIPEGGFKNKLRCFTYNLNSNRFKVKFEQGIFKVVFPDMTLLFKENPYKLVLDQEHYFEYYKPKKGDVIVDAGAYIGTVAIYLAKIIGESGKVICFEPDPKTYQKLLDNIKLNNVSNIVCVNKGLWSEKGKLSFDDKGEMGSTFLLNEGSNDFPKIEVVNMLEEIKTYGVNKVDFIKMDIEGSEIEVLFGVKSWLKENRPQLAIASYHIVEGKATSETIHPYLEELDYKVSTETRLETITYGY